MIIACYGGGEGSYYRAILNEEDLQFYPIHFHGLNLFRWVHCIEGVTEERMLILQCYFPDSVTYQKKPLIFYIGGIFSIR